MLEWSGMAFSELWDAAIWRDVIVSSRRLAQPEVARHGVIAQVVLATQNFPISTRCRRQG